MMMLYEREMSVGKLNLEQAHSQTESISQESQHGG
jgi:hypothetical protein